MLIEDGIKIGEWTVLDPDTYVLNGHKYLDCKCSCGKEQGVRLESLRSGTSTQCLACKRLKHGAKLAVPGSGWNTFYYRYQQNAKTRNLEFELTKEEFKEICEQDCWYCGSKPVDRVLSKSQTIKANGVDRVDNNVDYTAENCVSSCAVCNRMKLDMHGAAFLVHAMRIVKKHELNRRM